MYLQADILTVADTNGEKTGSTRTGSQFALIKAADIRSAVFLARKGKLFRCIKVNFLPSSHIESVVSLGKVGGALLWNTKRKER